VGLACLYDDTVQRVGRWISVILQRPIYAVLFGGSLRNRGWDVNIILYDKNAADSRQQRFKQLSIIG